MRVQSLGPEDPLEEDMETHPSILAWRIPWTEETGRLWSTGLQRITGSDLAHSIWLHWGPSPQLDCSLSGQTW